MTLKNIQFIFKLWNLDLESYLKSSIIHLSITAINSSVSNVVNKAYYIYYPQLSTSKQ
jgi:hypothetical protein